MNLVVRFTTLALVTATSFAAPSSQPATRESGQKNGLRATLIFDDTHVDKIEPIRFKVRFKVSDTQTASEMVRRLRN